MDAGTGLKEVTDMTKKKEDLISLGHLGLAVAAAVYLELRN